MSVWFATLLCAAFAPAEAATLNAQEYAKTVAKFTVETRIYDGWYTALLVRGTLLSDELRVVQDARVATITGTESPSGAAETIDIVLAASTQFRKELRLAADGSTPWTIQLRAGGSACSAPLSVTEVKKPSPLDVALYPHLTQWDTMFKLSYAANACGGATVTALDFSSARGHGSVQWEH